MCVLTDQRYKTYQTGFCSDAWVMPQGWDFGATGGSQGSIGKDNKRNRIQVENLPWGQTGDLGVRPKGQISLNFNNRVNFKIFTPNFVCSQKYKI